MTRTLGSWEAVDVTDSPENMTGVVCTPNQQELVECRQIRNGGVDLAHCYGPNRKSNAALMAAAPDLKIALAAILREGLNPKTRKKAYAALKYSVTISEVGGEQRPR